MSSRVLRKLHGEKDLPDEIISDTETDVPVSSGARRKQLNINRYDLLNQQSHSESEVKEDDNETEHASAAGSNAPPSDQTKRKKKKRKKKSGKSLSQRRSSEDNVDLDDVTRSVLEVAKILGDTSDQPHKVPPTKVTPIKSILAVQHRYLNAQNELKRMFGSKVIQAEQQSKRRGRGGRNPIRSTWLVTPKETWPTVGKTGLGMVVVDNQNGVQTFSYEHAPSYQQTQRRFLEAVESLNPENVVAIINSQPYHIDALLQLSDLCKMSDDLAVASELLERALLGLEAAFHPLFNIALGTCRLDYKRQENRALFIALFKHVQFLEGRACPRTALEVSKFLLSLNPDDDPLAVILMLDFYALRAKEYEWLVQLFDQWESVKNLSQLPNMAYSVAVSLYYLNNGGDLSHANNMLQNALIMFPGVLKPLLDKISAHIDKRVQDHNFFGPQSQTTMAPSLDQLCKLYIRRNHITWKDTNLLSWLEHNVHQTLDRVDNKDPFVQECVTRRAQRYPSPAPRNILRHVILSDFKDVPTNITEQSHGPLVCFDPLPPLDSINLYTRPQAPRQTDNSGAVSIFFQSLLPTFNAAAIAAPAEDQLAEEGADGGVVEGAGGDAGVDLRRSVASLLDAMRDLLSNIRLPDVPNDADVDENDESDGEDDHNNYLT